MDKGELAKRVEEVLGSLGTATYYELLGVPTNATADQVREAFHEKALIFHVDRYTQDLGELRAPMQRIFGEISKAHATLTDSAMRREYDAGLDLAERGVPTDVRAIFEADQAFRAGKRLLDRGSFRGALEQLRHAVTLHSSEPDYWAYAYWAEYGTLETDSDGEPHNVRRANELTVALEKLTKDHENCAPAHVFLGHVRRLQGDIEGARRAYRQAVRLSPDNAEAQSNLRLLDMRRENNRPKGFFARLFGKG
jgi:Flp pilus assembly protein TadD